MGPPLQQPVRDSPREPAVFLCGIGLQRTAFQNSAAYPPLDSSSATSQRHIGEPRGEALRSMEKCPAVSDFSRARRNIRSEAASLAAPFPDGRAACIAGGLWKRWLTGTIPSTLKNTVFNRKVIGRSRQRERVGMVTERGAVCHEDLEVRRYRRSSWSLHSLNVSVSTPEGSGSSSAP